MTREEAIDEIKRWTPILLVSGQCTEKTSKAQDMAISALENKGDLISRQAAIDMLGEAPKYKQRIVKTYAEGRNDQWFDDVTKLSLLPSIENKEEWIPVTERLPKIHQDVLIELRSGEMLTGFKAETEPYFYCHGVDGCYVEPQNVLAWQPLPKPYKAER